MSNAEPKVFKTSLLEEYTEIGIIGEGGSGIVYKVKDIEGKDHAIKYIKPKIHDYKQKLKRFKNEIKFYERTDHPNIVKFEGIGIVQFDGIESTFFVMPFYNKTLRELINEGLAPDLAIEYFNQILEATKLAHSKNIIHRDLKPENILFDTDQNRIVVADFGIARFEEEDLYTQVETKKGDKLHNAEYAAPEQKRKGDIVDCRADIYALGLILNEMFTKHVPQGAGYPTIKSLNTDYELLDDLVENMTQHDAVKRPQDIDQVIMMLSTRIKLIDEQKNIQVLKHIIINEIELDDPLIVNDVLIKEVDFDSKQLALIITLNQEINHIWQVQFKNASNISNFSISSQLKFVEHNKIIFSGIPQGHEQEAIDHFKRWLIVTKDKYKNSEIDRLTRLKQQEEEDIKKAINASKRREEVLSKIKW